MISATRPLAGSTVCITGTCTWSTSQSALASESDTMQSFGSSPAGQQIQTELQNAVTSALLGEKSAADALKAAQEAAMRAYDQAAG